MPGLSPLDQVPVVHMYVSGTTAGITNRLKKEGQKHLKVLVKARCCIFQGMTSRGSLVVAQFPYTLPHSRVKTGQGRLPGRAN